jgi:hypothetical protein
VTVAVVPLNVTVFWLGVVLYPVPKIVTLSPTAPLLGLKTTMAHVLEFQREMDKRFPTASYE